MTIRFPVSIKKVSEVLGFILSKIGYRLGESEDIDDEQYYLYMRLLPETQRIFEAVTLKSVLDLLGNESYQLPINIIECIIRHQLKENYIHYIRQGEIALEKSQWQLRKLSNQHKKSVSENDIQKPLSSPDYYGRVVHGESFEVKPLVGLHYQHWHDTNKMRVIF